LRHGNRLDATRISRNFTGMETELVVLHEHPEWQAPLFSALEARRVRFAPFDLKKAAFDVDQVPAARLYFNQASPSAYVRGNTRAVPFALSFMRSLETSGARVLNGSSAFSLELSKSVQGSLLKKLDIDHPASMAFNDVGAVKTRWTRYPALIKPEQGGSGARMVLVNSFEELETTLRERPDLWLPDNLLLMQEYFDVDPAQGIVRMEFVGGEYLYAMRVISHGSFNLCPSELCNPGDGSSGVCEVPKATPSVEFFPYPEVPAAAVEAGRRIMAAGGLDVGGIEYLETADGRRIFYDINANSNLRPAIGRAFGFDPFERVVDYLVKELKLLS
jgi:glutathione synthase/RimK-type ligase-like ATP-grasp enzyme